MNNNLKQSKNRYYFQFKKPPESAVSESLYLKVFVDTFSYFCGSI